MTLACATKTAIIENRKIPVTSHKLKYFKENICLAKLRGNSSDVFHHSIVSIPFTKNGTLGELKFTLCLMAKGFHRQTCYKCTTCEMPLCHTTIDMANDVEHSITCFELWHSTPAANLKDLSNETNAKLAEYQNNKQRRGTDSINQDGHFEIDCDGEWGMHK